MSLAPFRIRGEKMLRRWGTEIAEGEGKPNILAMIDHIPETGDGFYGGVGAMFSPLAEHADKLLAEMRTIDKEYTDYLVSYALGLSLDDICREFPGSRSKHNIQRECALSIWTAFVYMRAKLDRS